MFENDDEYMKSLKKGDSYHFTYSFEYIAKNYGNDNYDIDTANMEVKVNWDESQMGYVISYSVPEMYKIDPSQGNGSETEFYESDVYWRLMSDLGSIGIGAEAIVI
ncbi:hypothetical protein [Alkaliphilus serpentinus]|uniref:Uncharacterized protein n=1 Tax=Alkaliphilus serpentinus TaxID=1482731 RepID=A0A833HLY2_9FIRM|nr:hypothetical protein [Alkaliphilus serpentinus]KAB3527099.1 hypothetical protein F8153_13060 [Alkaliphilus serpentinus]